MADATQPQMETENISVQEQEWDDDSKDTVPMTTRTSLKMPEEQTTLPTAALSLQ